MEEDYLDKPTNRKGGGKGSNSYGGKGSNSYGGKGSNSYGGESELPEAFVNEDLVEDFCRQYEPGEPGQFDKYFTRAQLRKMLGCGQYGVDPYPQYIDALKYRGGFRERITPDGPGIYYREVTWQDIEEEEEDE